MPRSIDPFDLLPRPAHPALSPITSAGCSIRFVMLLVRPLATPRHAPPKFPPPVVGRKYSACTRCEAATGKSMLITGASTGIGEATAMRFANKGWTVFAGVRTRADASKLRETFGVEPLLLDVTSESSVREAAELVENRIGADGLDVLINNAGIGRFGPVEFMPLEKHEAVFGVNYFGLIRVTQKFLPALRCRNPGRIINVGSIAGKLALPMYGPYTSSKHALEALSDCMRAELGKSGIKVSLLQPGPVKTPIWDKAFGSIDTSLRTMGPEVAEMYGKDIMRMAELSEESALKGMDVQELVDVIEAVIRASNPKARYPCGKNVGWVIFFRHVLPDSVFDGVVQRMMNKIK